jgi:D-glycero-alpha-D-manno-heptose-7-phosphate kinase
MIVTRAPLRISLGGGGTDLPSYYEKYGGFVLSAAINKYVYINLNRPAADNLLRVKYSRSETVKLVSEIKHPLVREALKLTNTNSGLEVVSMADVPAGTGLGSSGSFTVALLTAIHALHRQQVKTQELAEQACKVEIEMAGQPVGKHDHYLAAFGGITSLHINQSGQVEVKLLKLSQHNLEVLRNYLMLFYTGIRRESFDILAQQSQDTKKENKQIIQNLHATKEIGFEIKRALEAGDLERFGELLDLHWQNKKKRSEKITEPRIDYWYELAKKNGALGGKIMGAGGGGFFLFCCQPDKRARLRKVLAEAGLREMPFDFDFEGAKVLVNF